MDILKSGTEKERFVEGSLKWQFSNKELRLIIFINQQS
jgi:hypothetical protein